MPTFPSWRPRRAIDHILVGDELETQGFSTVPLRVSDHLPVALTLGVPPDSIESVADAA